MNVINILDDITIRLIAAGEVIDSPVEVIKELIDNALDSQAKNIIVEIESYGKNVIKVIDDGIGMSKEDLFLSVERHATSKIQKKYNFDLCNLQYLGFRGEALYSISSVSKFSIESFHDGCGYKMTIDPYTRKKHIESSTICKGTKVTVRDIFYNMPIKNKFIKQDKQLFLAIKDIVNRFSGIHHGVGFKFIHEGKKIYEYHPSIWIKRLMNIPLFGHNFTENSFYVNFKHEDMSLEGHISRPTYNNSSRNSIFFYVNGRLVKDDTLYLAIKLAYEDLIPKGRYPYVMLNIIVSKSDVDVNIHPTKMQIKFLRKEIVLRFIIRNIKDFLNTNSNVVSEHIHYKALDDFIPSNKEYVNTNYNNHIKDSVDVMKQDVFFKQNEININSGIQDVANIYLVEDKKNSIETLENIKKNIDNSSILYDAKENFGIPIGQLYDSYILTQCEDNFFIIDQHAIHERIVYEDIKTKITNKENLELKQKVLFDNPIKLNDIKHIDCINNRPLYLINIGFKWEIINDDPFIIKLIQVPDIIKGFNSEQMLFFALDAYELVGDNFSYERLYANIACKKAIKAGQKMNIEEMKCFVDIFNNFENIAQCNHGRPTYIKISKNKILRLFERT